jgi:hypothetical protein
MDKLYIKVVAPKEINNFVVDNFSILNYLMLENFVLSFHN